MHSDPGNSHLCEVGKCWSGFTNYDSLPFTTQSHHSSLIKKKKMLDTSIENQSICTLTPFQLIQNFAIFFTDGRPQAPVMVRHLTVSHKLG